MIVDLLFAMVRQRVNVYTGLGFRGFLARSIKMERLVRICEQIKYNYCFSTLFERQHCTDKTGTLSKYPDTIGNVRFNSTYENSREINKGKETKIAPTLIINYLFITPVFVYIYEKRYSRKPN